MAQFPLHVKKKYTLLYVKDITSTSEHVLSTVLYTGTHPVSQENIDVPSQI